jgi:hypothetical protein
MFSAFFHTPDVELFAVSRPPWNPKRRTSVLDAFNRPNATQVFSLSQENH